MQPVFPAYLLIDYLLFMSKPYQYNRKYYYDLDIK